MWVSELTMGERSTFPKINNLTKSMPIDDGESPLISEKFALEFGKLSSKSLINIPYPIKVAMGITSKCLQKLGSDKSWGSVLEIVMNNPALQCLDVKDIYHHADHEAPAKRWFQSDGYLNKSGVR